LRWLDDMQTFLPYPDFARSAACLDSRRLGKQRVEAYQILNTLADPARRGWRRHPAVAMWRGYEDALRLYMNAMIAEWVRCGYRNTMPLAPVAGEPVMPPWLGDSAFHASHRSNLLRKNPAFYSRYGWSEPRDLPYVWPGERASASESA
jgi:hypothetical protein